MSKRKRNSTRPHSTKVKKSQGVGSRTITVPDSDEEELPPATANHYARVTKTRVASSGKAEKVTTNSVPIFEVEEVEIHAPLEAYIDIPAETENIVHVVPAKKRKKKVNDSVSRQIL